MYRVPAIRMQSRVFTVPGSGGRERPMMIGTRTDDNGELHYGGLSDVLLMPIITQNGWKVTVPLWCECKSGVGKLNKDQKAFQMYVEDNGAFFLECRDSADALLAWFHAHGVVRR